MSRFARILLSAALVGALPPEVDIDEHRPVARDLRLPHPFAGLQLLGLPGELELRRLGRALRERRRRRGEDKENCDAYAPELRSDHLSPPVQCGRTIS